MFEKHSDGICKGYHENRKERRGTSFRIRKLVRGGEAKPNSMNKQRRGGPGFERKAFQGGPGSWRV